MVDVAEIQFTKYTALGNDYLVVPPGLLSDTPEPADIIRLCDRKFGVGADGVLVAGPFSGNAPFFVRIFNSDGSECEKSGNGLRIYSQWLLDTGTVSDRTFTVESLASVAQVEVNTDGSLSIAMGRADFGAAPLGIDETGIDPRSFVLPTTAGDLDATALSLGNPHTVVFSPVNTVAIDRLGPEIARHPLFLRGTNVQFITAIDNTAIGIEVWERGSGYTLASGSSACAAAAAAISRGLVQAPLTVHMPGGAMEVFTRGDEIWQRGTAARVFDGRIDIGVSLPLGTVA